LPCLALPCLALPCLALPCLALPLLSNTHSSFFRYQRGRLTATKLASLVDTITLIVVDKYTLLARRTTTFVGDESEKYVIARYFTRFFPCYVLCVVVL
jgi:hypothetical protein